MKRQQPVSELDVMKNHCKSCPFKPNSEGHYQNGELANRVIERNLFKSQQICHSGLGNTHRCKGYYDYFSMICERLGLLHLLK